MAGAKPYLVCEESLVFKYHEETSIFLGSKNVLYLVYFWGFQKQAVSDPPPPSHTHRGSPWDDSELFYFFPDVQCLVGKTDAGLEYYSTNNSRSLPLAKGPFSCNNFLCMSGDKCWKCRLNSDDTDYAVIHKGKEFNSKVTCKLYVMVAPI